MPQINSRTWASPAAAVAVLLWVAPGQDLEALAEVGVSTDGDLAQALAQLPSLPKHRFRNLVGEVPRGREWGELPRASPTSPDDQEGREITKQLWVTTVGPTLSEPSYLRKAGAESSRLDDDQPRRSNREEKLK